MDPIDTTNTQLVGVDGRGQIIVTFPATVMTKADALRHAAWLVTLAGDDDQFAEVLAAVRST